MNKSQWTLDGFDHPLMCNPSQNLTLTSKFYSIWDVVFYVCLSFRGCTIAAIQLVLDSIGKSETTNIGWTWGIPLPVHGLEKSKLDRQGSKTPETIIGQLLFWSVSSGFYRLTCTDEWKVGGVPWAVAWPTEWQPPTVLIRLIQPPTCKLRASDFFHQIDHWHHQRGEK